MAAPDSGTSPPGRSLYRHLAPGEIRVYCMTSAPGARIEGYLKVIRIEPQPGLLNWLTTFLPYYEALSYCWGVQTKTQSITCNSENVPIHASLHDALLVLRQKCRGAPIWTDAICNYQPS